jgi:carboxypeptidase D
MASGDNCNNANFPGGITNGAAWYNVAGGMQDFNYLFSNAFDITLELSCIKDVAAETLRKEWVNNKESMLKYMEATNLGIKGYVVDIDGKSIDGARVQFHFKRFCSLQAFPDTCNVLVFTGIVRRLRDGHGTIC